MIGDRIETMVSNVNLTLLQTMQKKTNKQTNKLDHDGLLVVHTASSMMNEKSSEGLKQHVWLDIWLVVS